MPRIKAYRYTHKASLSSSMLDLGLGVDVNLRLEEYEVIRETPRGYWIKADYYKERWINKSPLKKSFAYLNKKDALTNFIKRKEIHLKYLKGYIKETEQAIRVATKLEKDTYNEKDL